MYKNKIQCILKRHFTNFHCTSSCLSRSFTSTQTELASHASDSSSLNEVCHKYESRQKIKHAEISKIYPSTSNEALGVCDIITYTVWGKYFLYL